MQRGFESRHLRGRESGGVAGKRANRASSEAPIAAHHGPPSLLRGQGDTHQTARASHRRLRTRSSPGASAARGSRRAVPASRVPGQRGRPTVAWPGLARSSGLRAAEPRPWAERLRATPRQTPTCSIHRANTFLQAFRTSLAGPAAKPCRLRTCSGSSTARGVRRPGRPAAY